MRGLSCRLKNLPHLGHHSGTPWLHRIVIFSFFGLRKLQARAERIRNVSNYVIKTFIHIQISTNLHL